MYNVCLCWCMTCYFRGNIRATQFSTSKALLILHCLLGFVFITLKKKKLIMQFLIPLWFFLKVVEPIAWLWAQGEILPHHSMILLSPGSNKTILITKCGIELLNCLWFYSSSFFFIKTRFKRECLYIINFLCWLLKVYQSLFKIQNLAL